MIEKKIEGLKNGLKKLENDGLRLITGENFDYIARKRVEEWERVDDLIDEIPLDEAELAESTLGIPHCLEVPRPSSATHANIYS